ncbi:unnamed protein product [Chondrus crispus]|uniref:Uncharacterized protein n=1 Tax=Chondrus crispus TaxID=2769 RepID=R7QUH9_CHOCR|nr:unnamed protein product [Chondrus crispus]CDF40975.1 unnamed protein product [Chondrus crispus]|eukprot:XP_005711269.1 unnamed protein product [Chondrus crispus]
MKTYPLAFRVRQKSNVNQPHTVHLRRIFLAILTSPIPHRSLNTARGITSCFFKTHKAPGAYPQNTEILRCHLSPETVRTSATLRGAIYTRLFLSGRQLHCSLYSL